MYRIVFTDEHELIVHQEVCESVKLHDEDTKIVMIVDGLEAINIGCTPEQYFIFNDDGHEYEVNSALEDDSKAEALAKSQFRYIEPEKIIEKQQEYIQVLEQKINSMEA